MCDMSTLERAIVIAAESHAGAIDKAGAPCILHCLRVMLAMNETNERIVGVLHDVVEDCAGLTFERIRAEGFSEEVIAALDSVTKRDGEEYFSFVRRAAANPIGRKVKLADLNDNSDLARISSPTERDFERIKQYRKAVAIIEQMDS
jgi:(p)ppGpp synthase/HD superfamily hydrolase